MYIKESGRHKALEAVRGIQHVVTMETCGITELVNLYHDDYRVRLWFDSWINKPAKRIERILSGIDD